MAKKDSTKVNVNNKGNVGILSAGLNAMRETALRNKEITKEEKRVAELRARVERIVNIVVAFSDEEMSIFNDMIASTYSDPVEEEQKEEEVTNT